MKKKITAKISQPKTTKATDFRQTLGVRTLIDLVAFHGMTDENYQVNQCVKMGDRTILVKGDICFTDVTGGVWVAVTPKPKKSK